MLKNNDLLRRCLFTLMIVGIYALGQQITLPVFNVEMIKSQQNQDVIWQLIGIATGGQTRLPTLLSVGIMPYMTGMIIWSAITSLDLQSINNLSRKTSSTIQSFVALFIGILQSILFALSLKPFLNKMYIPGTTIDASFWVAVLILTAGGMFAIVLANENSDRGIGGMVVLILPGMLLSLPKMLNMGWGQSVLKLTTPVIIVTVILSLVFLYFAVKLNRAEYRLPVQRIGIENDFYDSYLPIPLLASGGMPFMFSSMMFTLPGTIVTQMNATQTVWGKQILLWTDYTKITGVFSYAIVLIFLGYAFGLITFQPSKRVRELKESGDYIFNYAPGEETEKLLTSHFSRLTFAGNMVMLVIGVVPLLIGLKFRGIANYSPYLGNLFIIVTIGFTIGESFMALYNKNRYRLFDSL